MNYFIVKKDQQLVAIEATKHALCRYQEAGFRLIERVTSSSEHVALAQAKKRLQQPERTLNYGVGAVMLLSAYWFYFHFLLSR